MLSEGGQPALDVTKLAIVEQTVAQHASGASSVLAGTKHLVAETQRVQILKPKADGYACGFNMSTKAEEVVINHER
jgi:hypothetical protein